MTTVSSPLADALRDRYLLERELGQGGMATVYLARDLKHDRPVAIKVLHPELAHALGPERFLREITITAQFDHPYILSLLDSGVIEPATDTGRRLLYYVMPYVAGESLRDRMKREKQLPLDDALQITREVAEALGYAHARGVIHRDIKPENILLSGGHARVADFGIARAIDAAGSASLTETGLAIGTPAYMSPEQSMAERDVDGRSDLYALGSVLYEMLAGEPPYTGPTAQAIIAKRMSHPVPSVRTVRDAVPASVDRALATALARAPADRFPTAAQFAKALSDTALVPSAAPVALSDAQAVGAPNVPTSVLHWVRQLPRANVLLVLALLIGTGVLFAWQRGQMAAEAEAVQDVSSALPAERLAIVLRPVDETDTELSAIARGLTNDLIDAMRRVPPLTVVSSTGIDPFRSSTVAADSLGRVLQAGAVILGAVRRDRDLIQVDLELVGDTGAPVSAARRFRRPLAALPTLPAELRQSVIALLRARARGPDRSSAWLQIQQARQIAVDAGSSLAAGDTSGYRRAATTAESLAVAAERSDPTWSVPPTFRAELLYRRARDLDPFPFVTPDSVIARTIGDGLSASARALSIDSLDAQALNIDGTLHYWRYLRLYAGSGVQHADFRIARKQLERSVALDPGVAAAWQSLSHLYAFAEDVDERSILSAAQHAYEADPDHPRSETTVLRAFYAAYDLLLAADSERWCEVLQTRFEASWRASECQLLRMTLPDGSPDPTRAWALAARMVADTTRGAANVHAVAQLLAAQVLARAGLRDSARAVATRAMRDAPKESHYLLGELAVVQLWSGDTAGAISTLRRYRTVEPKALSLDDLGWRLAALDSVPAFRAMMQAH
jgi:serine/threonine-protein kinase